ncbi:hypothetical protein LguiA_019514 [Lonicera macranthoides]
MSTTHFLKASTSISWATGSSIMYKVVLEDGLCSPSGGLESLARNDLEIFRTKGVFDWQHFS